MQMTSSYLDLRYKRVFETVMSLRTHFFRFWTRSTKSQHIQNKASSLTKVNNIDVVRLTKWFRTIELNSVVDDFSIRTDGGIKMAQIIENKRTVSVVRYRSKALFTDKLCRK